MTLEKSTKTETDTVSQPSTPAAIKASVAAIQKSFTSGKNAVEPYDPNTALNDLPIVRRALQLFLESKMVESEDLLNEKDPVKERLYCATGYGLVQAIKGFMSYEDEDLVAAIAIVKHGNNVAAQHRKRSSFATKLASLVTSPSVSFVKSMTIIERHAELTYAETLFEKALLGIVYSGDWLQFIKEALNMRTCVQIYRLLDRYITIMDAESVEAGTGLQHPGIDQDFRSGVLLGMGVTDILLSLLPSRIGAIMEVFGYKGDRTQGLEMLAKAGGWTNDLSNPDPEIDIEEEGIRRPICDMALLIFHLVLSSFTFDGVDIMFANKILQWNLKRFPRGVFFLFGEGRMRLCRSQPSLAIESYTRAMEAQTQYANLYHISYWEIAGATLALWDIPQSLPYWRKLQQEATWSKACYTYGVAVCLLELGGEENEREADLLMERVPTLMQRIAGKSIPIEKFISRKARKFRSQKKRLALSGLEFAYNFLAIAHAPRTVITEKMLPLVEQQAGILLNAEKDPKTYGRGGSEGEDEYWDDLALTRFLKGVCLRYVAYPDPDAVLDPNEPSLMPQKEAANVAEKVLRQLIADGPQIRLDHHLVYHAHYELGRLLACNGSFIEARKHLDLVFSGKPLEVSSTNRKGKYSMENALILRTHAALTALDQGKPL
ncbi:hypothetical protein Clacol_008237 [Clathrus columnatus]|uniref:Tetratricopeptide repeat protein 39B n=1 Tax=Clathrus columnatus TaxID=1419009 RepID=A0AAV5AHW9_9AGAM|nr:hypothetical protein Clacol_008237 [Clathrus columnatus]